MMQFLNNLTNIIMQLPGFGPKSGQRMALYLAENCNDISRTLMDELKNIVESVKKCSQCGNVDTIEPCSICSGVRDNNILCIVTKVADAMTLENTGCFNGLYHILGKNISVMRGDTPMSLNLNNLEERIIERGVKEVLIATDATIEGQTTAHYIVDLLSNSSVKITRLSYGLPIGAEIDNLDPGTISMAIKMRTDI